MDFKSVWVLPVAFIVACSGGDHLAKVGDTAVTEEAFQAHLAFKRIDATSTEQVEAELDRYLNQAALVQAIEAQESIDTARLEAEVNEFRTQMLINRYMMSFLDATVTPTAIENYYNAHSEDYARQQAHVAHIVFRVHNAMTDAEKQAAAQKARDAVAKLAKGEAFDALAQAVSDDVYSAENGGDLGWIDVESVDPAFAEAALTLEPGQNSDIVESQYGYHIIRLIEPIKTDLAPLNQVEGDIRYLLRQKAKQAETERLMGLVDITTAE